MQSTDPTSPASIIPAPEIDSDEPVVAIPTASVAPLDGPPDGERITLFALAPKNGGSAVDQADVLGAMRASVLGRPLTWAAGAFSLGFLIARMRR